MTDYAKSTVRMIVSGAADYSNPRPIDFASDAYETTPTNRSEVEVTFDSDQEQYTLDHLGNVVDEVVIHNQGTVTAIAEFYYFQDETTSDNVDFTQDATYAHLIEAEGEDVFTTAAGVSGNYVSVSGSDSNDGLHLFVARNDDVTATVGPTLTEELQVDGITFRLLKKGRLEIPAGATQIFHGIDPVEGIYFSTAGTEVTCTVIATAHTTA